jgi:TRAP-type C4-dicarboxylate transport system permease small subunit
MTADAPRPAPGATEAETEALFREWEEREAHVDLSDLRPQDGIVFAVFWILFGVVLLQFFTRYVLNDSLGWTEEIARYLLILVTFIGSITAMRKGSHIAVEALILWLGPGARHWVLVANDFVAMAFCAFLAWYGWELGNRAPGYMVSIDVPKSVIYWAVAVALAGMTVHAAIRFVRRLRRLESDESHGLALD